MGGAIGRFGETCGVFHPRAPAHRLGPMSVASSVPEWFASAVGDEPVGYDRIMDVALYHPEHGYFSQATEIGRRGDFITSPEVGPLFGRLIARWLDRTWHLLGQPDPFIVAEHGAATGTLARTVRFAEPACAATLHYHLVERSAGLQAHSVDLPSGIVSGMPGERPHVVLANELLDNLPTRVVEYDGHRWREVLYAVSREGMTAELGDVESASHDMLLGLVEAPKMGQRVPLAAAAAAFVTAQLPPAACDQLLVIDYGATTAELAQRADQGWLRSFRSHIRVDPWQDLGAADITYDVPLDQLPRPTLVISQADWLEYLGIEDEVTAARNHWQKRAHIADLEAIRARSFVGEAAALTDRDGLGAFSVMAWGRIPE